MTKHVFISYCGENRVEVALLRQALIAAGEQVWWDQEIKIGQDWRLEISRAMSSAYAVLACLSQESEARASSGIYPELRDAIDRYRQYPPGSMFLFPLRLSACTLPDLPIDATRTLRDLQYLDLFPANQWDTSIQSLITALKAAPGHP